jgi:hypothetical protein
MAFATIRQTILAMDILTSPLFTDPGLGGRNKKVLPNQRVIQVWRIICMYICTLLLVSRELSFWGNSGLRNDSLRVTV